MLPYLLMLSSVFVHYAESFMMKKYNRKFAGGGFMFISIVSLFSSLFFLGKYFILDAPKGNFTTSVIPYSLCGGVFYASSSVLVFYAICMGSLAVTQMILGCGTIISTLFGIIYLKESANFLTYIGLILLAVAIYLLKSNKVEPDKPKAGTASWFVVAILGMLTSSAYSIISKLQQIRFSNTMDSAFAMMSIGLSFVFTFVLSIVMDRKQAFYVLKTCLPYASVAGISNGLNNLLMYAYYPLISYSIAVPTKSLFTKIFNFVMGHYVLKERYSGKQILGLIVVCIGVVLINVAKYI